MATKKPKPPAHDQLIDMLCDMGEVCLTARVMPGGVLRIDIARAGHSISHDMPSEGMIDAQVIALCEDADRELPR
jgi:hypothetical protein